MKDKIIYSCRIAGKLCELGFEVVDTMPNPKKPWFTCYLFARTPELEEALKQIVEEQKNG